MNKALVNWRTTLAGIPPLFGGLSMLFYALGPLFHSLAVGDLAELGREWPAVAAGFAAVSTGIMGILAKDAVNTKIK